MSQRLEYIKASPEGFKAMMGLERHLQASVEHGLLHLVKLRASQINGCAYCIDMHWKECGHEERRGVLNRSRTPTRRR